MPDPVVLATLNALGWLMFPNKNTCKMCFPKKRTCHLPIKFKLALSLCGSSSRKRWVPDGLRCTLIVAQCPPYRSVKVMKRKTRCIP